MNRQWLLERARTFLPHNPKRLRIPPGPRGNLVLGNTLEFQRDPLGFVVALRRDYGDLARFRVALDHWYLVSHPDDVYDITVRRNNLFYKPRIAKRIWQHFLGNGLVANDGASWKRQHKLVQPGFHKRRIEAYGDIMVRYTEALLDSYHSGERRDFGDDMTGLTLAIVAKTLFDADITGGDKGTIGEAMRTLNDALVEHINRPIPVPKWWPSKTNRNKHRAIEDVEQIIWRIIEARRASGDDHGDLLSMLVLAKDDTGASMTDRELRDEVMTLFFAGHETTAHAFTWIWYLLARHPEVEQKLHEELQSVLGKRLPRVSDLPSLPYLDMVVKEGMRVLPSVWSFMREPIEDVELRGHLVPKGSFLFISPYVLHHNPEHFPNPHEFRPERWQDDFEHRLPKGAYLPFSAGPRVCLGKSFAMMEARLVIGTLLQRMHARIPYDFAPTLKAQLSLHPGEGGLPIDVRFRSTSLPESRHPGAIA